MEYDYPGNIRELEHVIEHAFIRCSGDVLNPEHLPKDLKSGNIVASVINAENPLKALEREMVYQMLCDTGWKYSECAKKLKVSRTTLWRKMKELGIEKA